MTAGRSSGRIAAFLSACALVLAGCGEAEVTREEYGEELRTSMAELEESYGGVVASLGGEADPDATPDEIVAELRTLQVGLRDAGNRLDEIEAPQELERDHDDLVRGVRDMADSIDLLVEAQELLATDPKRAAQLERRFATDDSFGTVEAAASRISRAGVDTGL